MTTSGVASRFVRQPITRDLTLAYALSLLVAILMAAVSTAGLALRSTGLYGVELTLVQLFVGQDAANLIVGLPILLGSVWMASRSSLIGLLFWPGALFYVVYTYALYLVGAPFNALFLVYVTIVTVSVYTMIGVVASIDGESVRQRLSLAPARTVGGALVGVGLLATAGLTSLVIPALGDPTSVEPLLHARWIVDYTVGNPVLLMGGALLWRQARLGYVTAGGLLFLSGLNGVAFSIGGMLGALVTASPADAPVIAVHLVISAICFAGLAFFMRGADR